MIIFDRGKPEGVYPEERQEELLPQCDLIVITSSTLLNGTFSRVISYCRQAREVVLTGATTPLYPEAFHGTGVTVLAGSRWFPQYKKEIFTRISQGNAAPDYAVWGEISSEAVMNVTSVTKGSPVTLLFYYPSSSSGDGPITGTVPLIGPLIL